VIRHCVVFRFVEGTDPAAIEALAEALRALPGQIPEIAAYWVGPPTWACGTPTPTSPWSPTSPTRPPSAPTATHPAHVAVIRTHVEPIVAERHAVQFPW
jgi:hypothetical protein